MVIEIGPQLLTAVLAGLFVGLVLGWWHYAARRRP